MLLEFLEDGIARICVPFEDLYTTVFVLTEGKRCILFDTATRESDTKTYTFPALEQAGLVPEMIVCSHLHGDHAGGLPSLLETYPLAKAGIFDTAVSYGDRTVYLQDGDVLLDRFTVLNLQGHTNDCLALWDQKTNTLISGDCLQLQGIGKYGMSFLNYQTYMHTLARVQDLGLRRIIASHDYVPLGYTAVGEAAIKAYLDECAASAKAVADFIEEHPSMTKDEQAQAFARLHPDRPLVGAYMFAFVANTK